MTIRTVTIALWALAAMTSWAANEQPADGSSAAPAPATAPAGQAGDAAKSADQEPAPALPEQPPRVVMAKVGEREITVEDFVRYISKKPGLAKQAGDLSANAVILREMIIDALMKQAMEREGLVPQNPTPGDYQKAYQALAARHFPPPPPPSEEAAYEYYKAHLNEYGIPDMVRVSQIQFRWPKDAREEDKAAVRGRAEAALRRLEAGEDFAAVARELTENPHAKVTDGDLGFVDPATYAWSQGTLKGLKVGERTGVVESPVGYEIILVTDERKGLINPFPNIREQVMNRMRREAMEAARDAYARELQKTIKVTIVMEGLGDIQI